MLLISFCFGKRLIRCSIDLIDFLGTFLEYRLDMIPKQKLKCQKENQRIDEREEYRTDTNRKKLLHVIILTAL